MADAPKPITIKPIVINPKPAAPAAPAGAPAAAAPAARSAEATIRLKPVQVPGAASPAEKPAQSVVSAMKSKTSRISLDDAMMAQSSAKPNAAMGRLTTNISKEAAAVGKLTANVSAAAPAPKPTIGGGANMMQQTIRISDVSTAPKPAAPAPAAAPAAAEAPAAESPTIRRAPITIKSGAASGSAPTIKRTAVPGAGTKPVLKIANKPAAAPAESAGGDAAPAPAVSTRPVIARPNKDNGPFTVVASVFAILAIIVTILFCIVQASEACGRNRTLTQFSSMPDGPDIGWSGKLTFY